MSYEISQEAEELLADVKRFCDEEVIEACRTADRTGERPDRLYETAARMGYHTLTIPPEHGGISLCPVEIAALLEEMAAADAGFAVTMAACGLALFPILSAGNETQRAAACDLMMAGGFGAFAMTEAEAGSDAGAGRTVAVKDGDGYVLNGRKCFITNGSTASFYCVTARTGEKPGAGGLSLFFIEAGTPGLSAGAKEDKMGIRTSDTSEVILSDCRVGAEKLIGQECRGFAIAMEALNIGRAYMGAVAGGIARRAMEEVLAYGKTRLQFGKPITAHQSIRFKIADMGIRLETARQMTAYALRRIERGESFAKEAAMAKCYAADMAVATASEAIQILGGYGYSREFPVEKLLRDAKVFPIFEGTNEILHLFLADQIAGKHI